MPWLNSSLLLTFYLATFYLTALAQTDALTGGAGWASFGIAGAVLSWLLLVHLPSKDKQMKEFFDNKDKHIETIITSFRQESKEIRQEFKEALVLFKNHSDGERKEFMVALKDEFERLNDVVVQRNRDKES